MQDASLAIYEKISGTVNKTPVAAWTTGLDAKELKAMLKWNEADTSYVLREESVPIGYNTADDIDFTINEDGELLVKNVVQPDHILEMQNVTNKISVIAVDADSKNVPLADVKFELSRVLQPTKKITGTTAGTAKVYEKQLVGGETYKLTVTAKPVGYNQPDMTTYTMGTDGILKDRDSQPVQKNQIVIPLKRKTGTMEVTKVDEAIPANKLDETEFKLYRKNGASWESVTITAKMIKVGSIDLKGETCKYNKCIWCKCGR